jgi:hypothetical protein
MLPTELVAVCVTYCMFFKLPLSYIISAVSHFSLRSSHGCYVGITDSTMELAISAVMFTPRFIRICQLHLVTAGDRDAWACYHENVLAYKSKSESSFLSLTHLPGIPAAHPSSCHSLKEPLSQGPSLTRHAKLSVPPEIDTNNVISYTKLLSIGYSYIQ